MSGGTVITISRQLGSRGSYIAVEVAQALGLRYLDRETLYRAAEIAGFPDEQMIARLEEQERVPGFIGRVLDALATIPPVPVVPSATLREGYTYDEMVAALMASQGLTRSEALRHLEDERQRASLAEDYAELVKVVLLEYAQRGAAIIVGRGGQVILKELPNVLHVQVIAPLDVRVNRLMKRAGLDRKEAESQVRHSDTERARYMRHFHDVAWCDPLLYDFVINTGRVSVDLAVKLITQAAQRMAHRLQL